MVGYQQKAEVKHQLFIHRMVTVALTELLLQFPFEQGEIVWIVKPGYRAPLGEFRIVKAHPNNMYELVRSSDDTPHSELVEGKDLRRHV